MNEKRTFKNFTKYWDWARNISVPERHAALRAMSVKEQSRLHRQYEPFESVFTVSGNIQNLDDWHKWAENKTTKDRVQVIWAMNIEKKRKLIRECSQRRKRKEMKIPRYEFRFPNGDVFFSDKQDHQLSATANILVDHEKLTVEKNRHGRSGVQAYSQMFPEIDKKDIKDINDFEAIKAELDHWTPMETHLPIQTRITNIVNNYKSLSSSFANLQKAYRELEAKCP